MDVMNWALLTMSGDCNKELSLIDLDNFEMEIKTTDPEPAPLAQSVFSSLDSQIEDDGSPVLKLFYESFPGSSLRTL